MLSASAPHASTDDHGARTGPEASRMQGQWLLARLGKRVLRPGGLGLTRRLLTVAPAHGGRVVELGPGVGRTAELPPAFHPSSRTAVGPDPEGRERVTAILEGHPEAGSVVADAAATPLPDASADLVVGEAMLTIQSSEHKREIIAEVARVPAPGDRYVIHEPALRDDRSPEELKAVRQNISRTIMVGARPLPQSSWKELLTGAGLMVKWTGSVSMHLLEPRRIVEDEGLLGAIRSWRAVRRTPGARERVRAMRQNSRLQGRMLSAVGIVARKPTQ